MEERMPPSTLSTNEDPATTSIEPTSTMPPMMKVRARPASRLRVAIRTRTLSSPPVPAMALELLGGGRLAADDLPVGDAHHRVGVAHHLGVVGGEDEGGAVALVHVAHQVDHRGAG